MSNHNILEDILLESSIAGMMRPMAFINTPMGPTVDPDTFMGKAGLRPSVKPKMTKKQPCGCPSCVDDPMKAPIMGGAHETVENTAPTLRYIFSGPVVKGLDPELALGYHYTKFMSLLQKMVAPLPLINKVGAIELVASPALKRGLGALAKGEGLQMKSINEAHCTNEGHCVEVHCTNEGHCQ